jgi:hypothetical protein
LHQATLLTCHGQTITSEDGLKEAIATECKKGLIKATCKFAAAGHHAMHPVEGSLRLYYDQISIIAKHMDADDTQV